MLTLKQRKDLWHRRGITCAVLARVLGVSTVQVVLVLNGERRSPVVEQAIARILGVAPDVAFPPAPPRKREAPNPRAQLPADLLAAVAAEMAKPSRARREKPASKGRTTARTPPATAAA